MAMTRTRLTGLCAVVLGAVLALAGCGSGGNASGTSSTVAPDKLMSLQIDKSKLVPAPGSPSAATQEAADSYTDKTLGSLDSIWDSFFVAAGGHEGMYQWVPLGTTEDAAETFESACRTTADETINSTPDDTFALYCPKGTDGQGTLTTPFGTIVKMWPTDFSNTTAIKAADLAVTIYLASPHGQQVAHEMREQFGLKELAQGDANQTLLADCFAGVWAGAAYPNLSQTAIEAAMAAQPTGNDPVTGAPYGSPENRTSAFSQGYVNLTPGTCIKAYWPQSAG
jgi:predicted metalloprotease